MSRRHWDGLALLARMAGSTPSGVLTALVEQAVNDAADAWRRLAALDADEAEQ
jgi:hypothetical protein